MKRWKTAKKRSGLGDLVEEIAQPIAQALDIVFHTTISGCGSCQKRKEKLNEWMPFKDEEDDNFDKQ